MTEEKTHNQNGQNNVCPVDMVNETANQIQRHFKKTAEERVSEIDREFMAGFACMETHGRSVSIYGSARSKENDPYYIKARALGSRIVKELGYAIVTGGGPGIMEAANRGAKEVCGQSIGFTIQLPKEQNTNPYLTHSVDFKFFFARRVMLAFSAETYIFFPGGFGTFDEFFEILTLVQTHKIPHVPMVLVGKEFWDPIKAMLQERMIESHQMISPKDNELYTITDSEDEIMEIIKKAKPRRE